MEGDRGQEPRRTGVGRGTGDGRRKGGKRDLFTMVGSGREIKKGKLSLFVAAYFQSKKRTQQRFLTSV